MSEDKCKAREKEVAVEFLARKLYISSAARVNGTMSAYDAFSLAESYIRLADQRWKDCQ